MDQPAIIEMTPASIERIKDWTLIIPADERDTCALMEHGNVLMFRVKTKHKNTAIELPSSIMAIINVLAQHSYAVDVLFANDVEIARKWAGYESSDGGQVPTQTTFFRQPRFNDFVHTCTFAEALVLASLTSSELWFRPTGWKGWDTAFTTQDGQIISIPDSRGGAIARMPETKFILGTWDLINPNVLFAERSQK
jgi:hypothetical protein